MLLILTFWKTDEFIRKLNPESQVNDRVFLSDWFCCTLPGCVTQALILQGVLLHLQSWINVGGGGKRKVMTGWWGDWNAKETILGNVALFVTRVRMEPDRLLHNFCDYKNLKADVVGICMRTSTHQIIFICEHKYQAKQEGKKLYYLSWERLIFLSTF